jgi:hypothetical protein
LYQFHESESALLDSVPELTALRGLMERTDWHDDDPLEQTLRLWRWLQRLPDSLLETMTVAASLSDHLAMRTGVEHGHTMLELLSFAGLIHDIGKAETYQAQSDGTTRCTGHEVASARMAPAICARFDFTPQETDFIVRLVTGHGEPYVLFKLIAPLPEPERERYLRRFEEDWGDDLLFLVLLAYGDLVTSHLGQRRPEKYAAIIPFYQVWLRHLVNQMTVDGSRVDR